MKVKDGICGLTVGDALGVPAEFYSRMELEEHPVTEMIGGGHHRQPPGTWSDDTAMTLSTIDSIVDKKTIDYEDLMDKFCDCFDKAKYWQYEVFDCGITTGKGIDNYKSGIEPINCGATGERDNGNGSLMRILPLAYIPNIDYETIENVSGLTHSHMRSKIACILYIEIARSMLENDLTIDEHVKSACDKIKSHYADSQELVHFKKIFDDDLNDVESGGYVIKTLESVIHCLKTTENYKGAVLKAVNLGEDSDTVAAICGGLAGIYYGFDAIPIEWTGEIPGIEYIYELCERYESVIDECF